MYIREAHPADSNWPDDAVAVDDPVTLAQRHAVARQCRRELSLTLPTVVDDMQDSVNQAYRAWPERIYVLERDGVIAYKGALGPFGFDPRAAERALKKLL